VSGDLETTSLLDPVHDFEVNARGTLQLRVHAG
jgi:hypothetical protein